LDAAEIPQLRAALDVPFERLLIELALTTGIRSGEVSRLTEDSAERSRRSQPYRRRHPIAQRPARGIAPGGIAAALP
jgi:hypothetical protein